jgi:hypothetical protein
MWNIMRFFVLILYACILKEFHTQESSSTFFIDQNRLKKIILVSHLKSNQDFFNIDDDLAVLDHQQYKVMKFPISGNWVLFKIN